MFYERAIIPLIFFYLEDIGRPAGRLPWPLRSAASAPRTGSRRSPRSPSGPPQAAASSHLYTKNINKKETTTLILVVRSKPKECNFSPLNTKYYSKYRGTGFQNIFSLILHHFQSNIVYDIANFLLQDAFSYF